MGLDIVELVMAVEEEFDVDIPDKIQETISTVGRLADVVTAELQRLGRPADPESVFERIRIITSERAEIPPDKIWRESSFIDDLGMD